MTGSYAVVLVVVAVAMTLITMTAIVFGIQDGSTTLILTALGSLGTIITALIGALRANEAAIRAGEGANLTRRTINTTELTASKLAALQQAVGSSAHPCHDKECTGPP